MYDKDDFKQQAILKFTDITNRRVQATEEPEEPEAKNEKKSSKEEMQMKIATAKMHANKELETFREATEEYIKKIKGLVLFEGIDAIVEELMIDQLLQSIIAPAVKGRQIPGMPEEHYRLFRTEMYKALIKEYIDKA